MKQAELEQWFEVSHSGDASGTFRHTWCRQPEAGRWKQYLPQIVRYLERAHADARELFHSTLHLSLDPVPATRYQPSYPNDMPLKAKKGFFGEALCGMFTEASEILGGDDWIIPAFLFRLHSAAEDHLFRLVMNEKTPKDIPGRTGSDFVAIAMGQDGQITRFLNGEAKCHEIFNITKCKQFLTQLSEEGPVPVSLPQLIRILKDQDKGNLTEVIDAIDRVFWERRYDRIPKINLFLYLFDQPGVVSYDTARITEELTSTNYTTNVPLHVFEVFIPDGTDLVKQAYNRVFREVTTDVAV